MSFVLSLSRLVPVALRHLDAYKEIAEKDTQEAVAALASRATLAMIAFGASVVAALMICASIIAVTWDGPYRTWSPIALAGMFALSAGLARLELTRRRAGKATLFLRTRRELRADRELIERSFTDLDRDHGSSVRDQ